MHARRIYAMFPCVAGMSTSSPSVYQLSMPVIFDFAHAAHGPIPGEMGNPCLGNEGRRRVIGARPA